MAQSKQLVATHVGAGYTDDQWEFIFELKCYGYTYSELANWLGVTEGVIKGQFRRLGLFSVDRLPLSTYDEKLRKLGDADA